MLAGYLTASNEVWERGGQHPERLRPFLTAAQYEIDAGYARTMRRDDTHRVGPYSCSRFVAESFEIAKGKSHSYACVDGRKATLVDSHAHRVPTRGGSTSNPVRVTFVHEDGSLRIAKFEQGSGSSSC